MHATANPMGLHHRIVIEISLVKIRGRNNLSKESKIHISAVLKPLFFLQEMHRWLE